MSILIYRHRNKYITVCHVTNKKLLVSYQIRNTCSISLQIYKVTSARVLPYTDLTDIRVPMCISLFFPNMDNYKYK